MRFLLVSRHLPDPEGTAAGRILHATGQGLLAEGHDVRAWSWNPSAPSNDLPTWCEWLPLHPESWWRTRLRAVVRPRSDVVRADWSIPPDAFAVAEEPVSHAAVAGTQRHAGVLHYLTALDVGAVGRWKPRYLQDHRLERRVARRDRVVLAYSRRVVRAARRILGGVDPVYVPAAVHVPQHPVPSVSEPIATLLADWRWPPNRVALDRLLRLWPDVRARVTGASLLLAGRGEIPVGTVPGVRFVGEVARSSEILSQSAVLAFPCPGTSGPKMKVMEALARGVAVATTPAGMEGIELPSPGHPTAGDRTGFVDLLCELLTDEERRHQLARRGRDGIARSHAPGPAARARVAVCRDIASDAD